MPSDTLLQREFDVRIREFDVRPCIYIGMGLPCTMAASYLARCLQAALHGVCKLPCTGSASHLARGLQATLHDGCKLPCTRCARKSAFPEAVVGANDYSPLREGHMIEVLRHPQSLCCDTHNACFASLTKPALSVSHWEGCLPRGGKGVSPEAGRVSPPVRGYGFLTSNSRL